MSRLAEPACPDVTSPSSGAGTLHACMHERHLQILGEMTEDGLEVSRLLRDRIKDAKEVEDAERLALAYARATRAVRLSIMLREQLMRDLGADAARPAETPELTERKARVQRILGRVIEREHRGDSTKRMAAERLDQDFCGDIMSRPISELIAVIARDLNLKPDWKGLMQEAWAEAEITSGAPGWPLATASRPPGPSPLAPGPSPLATEVGRRKPDG